ncbi:MAG: hypothetical protein EZS28_002606 [Streblomastix strix]|uniref:Uncharacterized protein n=1 Tax=Streblomastix strix TaxID=222440 RepID=A0A5J4X539_9EUKA|nr:MAG: hypothetical protein EZS28_002606 [Streblomastix strix]
MAKNHVGYYGIANNMSPQVVENPSQNLSNGAAAVFVPLKLITQRAYSISVFAPLVTLMELSQIPNVLEGIVIVQLTQHAQKHQQVAVPQAPSGALVYLVPVENNIFTGQSKNLYFDRGNDYGSVVRVHIISLRAIFEQIYIKWSYFCRIISRASSSQSYRAVLGPLDVINPTAGMIARGVGGAAGMTNKFLNR